VITARLRIVLLASGLVLAACASGTGAAPPTAAVSGAIDPALTAPLEGLPPCGDPPAAATDPPAPLTVPAGGIVTRVDVTGPLTNVQGWLPYTPVEIRVHYEGLAGWESLQSEDEIWEAELLLTDGDTRIFLKAQAVCRRGSVFVAVLAADDLGGQLPTPAGGG
jgi:hypothetical protein